MIPSAVRPYRRALAIVAMITVSAPMLIAQCPDGSPPPCKSAAAAAAARRVNPPLNERAWIVVPFGNVTRARELDWLRDASVNLLSMDLSRWTDITVIDDKHVGDLMRELPSARSAESLTLSDGISIARRAGAGRLVMGDFIKVGRITRLVANVFDVRTGAKLRSAEQQTPDADSLLAVFSPLARGVLDVPPPPDAKLGALGTKRTDAYREYLLGAGALNTFAIADAIVHLKRALALDSTFALAHFKLSLAMGWNEVDRDSVVERAHAAAAARFGASLPARERTLIAGRLAEENDEYGRACDAYASIVARDSMDVEGLYGLGECSFHDAVVTPLAEDSTRARFRGNWNVTLRAFQRVLQIDPSFHLAFNHILDILSSAQRFGCTIAAAGGKCRPFSALVFRDHDSVVVEGIDRAANASLWSARYRQLERERPYVNNLIEARARARDWVESAPGELRARYYLASTTLRLGDVPDAYEEARKLKPDNDGYLRGRRLPIRFETSFKMGHGAEARALLDSMLIETPDVAPDWNLGATTAAFGRFSAWNAYRERMAAAGRSVEGDWYYDLARAMLGIPSDSLNLHEHAWHDARGGPTCNRDCQRIAIFNTLMYAPRASRTWWPSYPAVVQDVRMVVSRALATGDTGALRTASGRLDSLARQRLRMGYSEAGYAAIATDGYLALGDSVSALRMARLTVDSVTALMPWNQGVGASQMIAPLLWVRMMIIRADLEAAIGSRDSARLWYGRVLDLWVGADPELQPAVARMRAALAKLGPSRGP